ncbi:ISMca6, transposase, OrfA [Nitrococcus mobilis Nb-231]|uniref:ISMca6, transposase, OrfA n=1 Tax=Nitrococcus mobilis Nb-231 TaxID=314278 RepID=A4BTE6_9GAMM|nr:ISMca6, transposase, OrfA [Nitrococcus mobilis Nb-231]
MLGHVWITDEEGEKHHEIQAAQQLIEALGLSGRLFTLDALHTQKKPPSS